MGKQALSSHARGKKHTRLEAVRKCTVPISIMLAANSQGPNATAVMPGCTKLIGNSEDEKVSLDNAHSSLGVLTNAIISFKIKKSGCSN